MTLSPVTDPTPGHLKSITLPVVEDQNLILSAELRTALQPGTSFSFIVDQAIQALDRRVYVHGQPPNAIAYVEGWIANVRWQISTHWNFDCATNEYNWNSTLNLTHEHFSSGELLAEGISILLAESRLQVPRQRFFFIEGAHARPDYRLLLPPWSRRAILVSGRNLHLETRSRKSQATLHAQDISDLKAKKAAAKNVVASYCFYGCGTHLNGLSYSRIQLADPPGEENNESFYDLVAGLTAYYGAITSQLGLWEHRDHLDAARLAAGKGEVYNTPLQIRDRGRLQRSVIRTVRDVPFRGREFNSLLHLASTAPHTLEERRQIQAQVEERIRQQQLGALVFRGVRESVLELIEQCRWEELYDFYDPLSTEFASSFWVRSDGVVRIEDSLTAKMRDFIINQARVSSGIKDS